MPKSYGGTGTGTIDKSSVANSIASVNGREASEILRSNVSFPDFLGGYQPSFSGPSFSGPAPSFPGPAFSAPSYYGN